MKLEINDPLVEAIFGALKNAPGTQGDKLQALRRAQAYLDVYSYANCNLSTEEEERRLRDVYRDQLLGPNPLPLQKDKNSEAA